MFEEKTAWTNPNPLLQGFVILPDGLEIERSEAEALGFKIAAWPEGEKTATPHPHAKDSVVLPRGRVLSRESAKEWGFTVAEHAGRNAPKGWRAAIMTLAEARDRPSATAELLTSRTPETISVEQARAFLRGLPIEQTDTTEETMTITNEDPARAARLAEISGSIASFNRDRGWTERQRTTPKPAPAVSSVEPERLKRLAEIRFNALQMNSQGHTQEAKKLKCALDAHATTGAPLSRLLAQLEVDTSKFVPST
ncbi:hypothetical protein ACTGJ9_022820 [Bradyrhizobium sp. RDM12]